MLSFIHIFPTYPDLWSGDFVFWSKNSKNDKEEKESLKIFNEQLKLRRGVYPTSF